MFFRSYSIFALSLLIPLSAAAESRCDQLLKAFGNQLADATCVESADLTTDNPATTPANNSIARRCRPFAFTPQTDRAVIAPSAAKRTPITKVVPGVQIDARIARDPTGQARFLLRLPDDWNGRLVVAGASGTRSEFNGDFAWSDYVVQKGYAYASQNKGVLNLQLHDAPPTRSAAGSIRRRRCLRPFLRQRCRASPSRAGPTSWSQAGAARADGVKAALRQVRRATPTRSARRTAATRCAARSRRRPSCSTAASTGKAPSSTSTRRTC